MAGPLYFFQALVTVDLVHPQAGSQQPTRPVSHPQTLRGRPGRCGDDRCIINHLRAAWTWDVNQPLQTVLQIAAPPQIHRRSRHPHQLRDQRIRDSLGGQQHDPRPLRCPCGCGARTHHLLKYRLVTVTKRQSRSWLVRHTPIIPPNRKAIQTPHH